jgi:hypothetical protein
MLDRKFFIFYEMLLDCCLRSCYDVHFEVKTSKYCCNCFYAGVIDTSDTLLPVFCYQLFAQQLCIQFYHYNYSVAKGILSMNVIGT